ncbi:MAG: helix-turn-helix domain-containing protein [Pseudomonadota bacterium]
MKKQEDIRACSVGRTLQILGDKWLFLILREAFFGLRHYDEFAANLNIATNILSARLKILVENGILKKERDPADGRRFTYGFTRKGLDLYPITLALMQWGDRWLAGPEGPPLFLTHRTCGNRLEPVMCCRACGKPVTAPEITYQENPAAQKAKGEGMTGKEDLIHRAYGAFSGFKKPARCVIHGDDCPECRDHQQTLARASRETLSMEDLGPITFSPLPHMSPEALAYFLPRLAELAVKNQADVDREPFLTRFIALVHDGPEIDRFRLFGPEQRRVVADTLKFLREHYAGVIQREGWTTEWEEALGRWRA